MSLNSPTEASAGPSGSGDSHDFSAIKERLETLEKENKRLSALYTKLVEEDSEEKTPVPKAPACEILRVDLTRWKELIDGTKEHPDFSLLTVAPKGRGMPDPGDNSIKNELEAGTVAGVTQTESIPNSDLSLGNPYRILLNGRLELMGVLGAVLKLPPLSSAYWIWLWPFKHLVVHGDKLRARYAAEEAKAIVVEEGQSGDADGVERKGESSHSKSTSGNDAEGETRLRDELRCLVEFMDVDMKSIFTMQKELNNGKRKTITFDYLWLLFKPGDLVISGGTQKRAYIISHIAGGRALHGRTSRNSDDDWYRSHLSEAYLRKHSKTTPFVIDCFYVDFDGTHFGPLPANFSLAEFDGEVSITSLEVFPARYDDTFKETEKTLVRRGKRFVKVSRAGHKYYAGQTVKEHCLFNDRDEVKSEIIIDVKLALRHFRETFLYNEDDFDFDCALGSIVNPHRADDRELKEYGHICPVHKCTKCRQTRVMDMNDLDNENKTAFLERTPLLNLRLANTELSNEVLMLLPPRVFGFALLNRKWYAFDIDHVEDIKNTDQTFDHLVLPPKHKKIMRALVHNHTRGSTTNELKADSVDEDFSMDLIRGKGKGLIILLHGVPGVGKTSTAESVAAQTRRPLFSITCGDIGTTASKVEKCLNDYFDMAHKWGCVLLLDEADVFLAKREKGGDLERNGIVSVFLRVLEYYSGILILTTNRIGQFDEAFSSRVHIKLYYPKLDQKSTIKIWRMNLKRIPRAQLDLDVEDNKIIKFAKQQWAVTEEKQTQRWNGRQIKNAFQTAIALARWDHQEAVRNGDNQRACLSVKQFEIVTETSAHFDNYISMMHGVDEGDTWDVIAARELLRKNEKPRKVANRSGPVAPSPRTPRRNAKVEVPEEDDDDDDDDDNDDDDDDDSDENEEKMKELEEKMMKLKRRRKVKGVANGKMGDVLERGLGKAVLNDVKDPGESSDSSD